MIKEKEDPVGQLTRNGTGLLGRMRRDTKNSPSRGRPGGDSSEGYSSGGLRYHRTRPLGRELGFGHRGQGKGLAVGAEDSVVWGTSLCRYGVISVEVSLVCSWEIG